MVGEIRDAETANLAIQAALTGHLVFSTLHTNSAAGILPRLIDMGIEPFMIASTLNTVIGQRLVRRVAERRENYRSSELETNILREVVGDLLPKTPSEVPIVGEKLGYQGLPLANSQSFNLVKGIPGEDAPNGYKGRAGIYETITVDEDVKVKGQENAYKQIVTGAVGGAAGVIHAAESATTDCQPNENVEALRVGLDAMNIEARPVWKPMHKQPVYKNNPAYVNGASEAIFKVGMCLPAGPYVSDDDVCYIVEAIKSLIA